MTQLKRNDCTDFKTWLVLLNVKYMGAIFL